MITHHLEGLLKVYGLYVLAQAELSDEESHSTSPDTVDHSAIILVGNRGSSYWPAFERSKEYGDHQPNPLDRWSRRIGVQIADEVNGKCVFPFDGPPFHPFQRWAKRSGTLEPSPLGLMIHPEYGLWHSYRFGLLLNIDVSVPLPSVGLNPCHSCYSQPCLNTCPVEAFNTGGYQVQDCVGHLRENANAICHSSGCLARLACPSGEQYTYQVAQNRFHLKAFLDSRE